MPNIILDFFTVGIYVLIVHFGEPIRGIIIIFTPILPFILLTRAFAVLTTLREPLVNQVLSKQVIQDIGVNTIKEEVVKYCLDLPSHALPSLRKLFLLFSFEFQQLEVDVKEIMDHMALRKVILMSIFYFLHCVFTPICCRARTLWLW